MTSRKITSRYLTWVTDRYFSRYMTSSAHLRRLLLQRVRKTQREYGGEEEPAVALVDAEVARLEGLGVLNDALYAADVARALARRGAGQRKIRAKLAEKGLYGTVVDEALATLAEASEGDPELAAAKIFARKRRIGPYRRGPVDDDGRQKELGKMGRAGFSWGIAQRVVDAAAPEDLDE